MTEGALGRLERRVRRRLGVVSAFRRVAESLPAIVQILVAVAGAYAIAAWGFGHAVPLLAVTVTITSLGFSRDARPRRVAESLLGIILGIVLADALAMVLGKGIWQLLVVLLVVFVLGRAVSANPAFAVAAAVPSALVTLLPEADGGPFARSLDGLIGGAIALIVTALIPRDPRRTAIRDAKGLFSVFAEALGSLVDALGTADEAAGDLASTRLQRAPAMLATWSTSLDTAISIARISPFLRRRLPELRRQARIHQTAELTARHLVALARRVAFLVRDGERRPRLASVLGRVANAVSALGAWIEDPESLERARPALIELAGRLDPLRIVPGAGPGDAAIVMQLRPLVVDLLVATGMPLDEARALLPVL